MKTETLIIDAVEDIKTMYRSGVNQSEIVESVCPEIPYPFRLAMVKRIIRDIEK